jgi:hypothetical protein
MGFKNETSMTLVIQEQFGTGNSIRYGKPQKIFPNETVRDFPPPGGQRKFVIFDAAKPDKPIFTGSLNCPSASENFLFSLNADDKGSLTTELSKSPAGGAFTSPKKDSSPGKNPPKRKP